MFFRLNKKFVLLACAVGLLTQQFVIQAQAQTAASSDAKPSSLGHFIDQTSGLTADDVVAYALTHNLELQAARKEIDAAKAMVKQARLRANPKIDIGLSQNVT